MMKIFSGLIDFGEDGEKGKAFHDKANHRLVFMFIPLVAKSLADQYAQPVGVIA